MYAAIRTGRDDPSYPIEDKHYFGVCSEVLEDCWSLMFTVPYEFISRNLGGFTDEFYGNIYKCGGKTEHYLSFYPIKTDDPDFHRPEFFGEFIFER